MTNRIELRDLMEAALIAAATSAEDRVYTARTYPTTAPKYPLIRHNDQKGVGRFTILRAKTGSF